MTEAASLEIESVVAQTIYIRSFDSIKVTDPTSDDPDLQVQLDGKEDKISLPAHQVVISNDNDPGGLTGGLTVSVTKDFELAHVSGVTAPIQTQLNSKQPNITGAASTITSTNLPAGKALASDDAGKVAATDVDAADLAHVAGVTGPIQTQLNGKQGIVAGVTDTEIGYLSGATSNLQTQLNDKQGIVPGVTDTEIGYLSGVTSNLQTQLNGKQAVVAGVTDTEIGYLSGATSNLQDQIDAMEGIEQITLTAHSNASNPNDSSVQTYTSQFNSNFGWSAPSAQGSNNIVHALATIGTDLYVGGGFTSFNGAPANNIVKYSGGTWSALGDELGTDGRVECFAVAGTDLYAGGLFFSAGGSPANNIAKYSGGVWTTLGDGLAPVGSARVLAMAFVGTDLYVGGEFSTAGGVPAQNIAVYSGGVWSALGTGADGFVYALTAVGTDLYVGGAFTNIAGTPANFIAKYSGGVWSTLGGGVNNAVRVITPIGTDLYVGGVFTFADGLPAARIAKYSGGTWSALGTGFNLTVSTIAAMGTTHLFVGGAFATAGGQSANYIARYDLVAGGNAWSRLGSGTDGTVNVIHVVGTDVYAGGAFTTAGGVAAKSLAKFDTLPLTLKSSDGTETLHTFPTSGESMVLVNYPAVFSNDVKINNIGYLPMIYHVGTDHIPHIVPQQPIILSGTANGDASGVVTVTWSANDGFSGFSSADTYRLTFSYESASDERLVIWITAKTASSFTFKVTDTSGTASNKAVNYHAVGY